MTSMTSYTQLPQQQQAGHDPDRPRRDNVEYHKGRRAAEAGQSILDNPYMERLGDSRFNRWNLGWCEASETSARLLDIDTT